MKITPLSYPSLLLALLSLVFASYAQKPDEELYALKLAVEEAKLVIAKNYENGSFGNAVSVSGDRAAIGAYRDDTPEDFKGGVYIYEFNGTSWNQVHQIIAADGVAGDNFGSDVVLIGDDLYVGAERHNNSKGAVYVYAYDAMNDNWAFQQKVETPNITGFAVAGFGSTISVSAGRMLVGASGDTQAGSAAGAAFYFEHDGNSWVEIQKILASDAAQFDFFGRSVEIFGFKAVIGAIGAGSGDSGAAYVFDLNLGSNTFIEVQKLLPNDASNNQQFGSAVTVYDNDMIIGSNQDPGQSFGTGAAYYFAFNGGNNTWEFQQKLTASDAQDGAFFAETLSLQANRLAVGAYRTNGVSINNLGAVYVFEKDMGIWQEQVKIESSDGEFNDSFGIAVDIDVDRLLTGAYAESEVSNLAGAAYMFDFDGLNWNETQKLLITDAAINDDFGSAVDIDGATAIVGAQSNGDNGENAGMAYVFDFDGSHWSLTQTLQANDAAANQFFGSSVGISGDWLAVASHVQDAGYVYLFEHVGGIWQQQQKVSSSDGAAGDFFGRSLEINGSRMIVGASFDDDFGSSSGAAYVFDESGGSWSETDKLLPNDGAMNDYFGHAVAIDGDRAVVGAWSDDTSIADTGSAYVFEFNNGNWSQTEKLLPSNPIDGGFFGFDVALQNDWAMVGAHGDNDFANESGAVYVFNYAANVWSETQKITPASGSSFDRFGRNIDLDGLRLVVGSSLRDTAANNAGAVFSYEFNGVNWVFDEELFANDAADNDYFGSAVGLSGNRFITGAPADDNNWIDDGAAYVINVGNRYDLIVHVVDLYPGASIGNNHRSPNSITVSNAADSVLFTGGQVATQVISNLADGDDYDLMFGGDLIFPEQTCSFDNPITTGTISGSDVTYTLTCVTTTFPLRIQGTNLVAGTEAVVENQLLEQISVQAGNMTTTFPTPVEDGSIYDLSVITQPTNPSQFCSFFNDGLGFMNGNTTVWINCVINQFTMGGTVTGLLAGNQLLIQNNGTDDLLIAQNGAFQFATELDDLSVYDVQIVTQPGSPIQICGVTNGQGNLSGSDVTNITINCPVGDDLIYRHGFE